MFDKINKTTKALEKALDASWMRNEAIAQNIANIDTPGYKRKDVKFEEYLSQALEGGSIRGRTTHERHIPVGKKDIDDVEIKAGQDNSSLSMRLDGNNVDIDVEMAQLAKNSIKYQVLTQSLNTEYKRIKSVIYEGRR